MYSPEFTQKPEHDLLKCSEELDDGKCNFYLLLTQQLQEASQVVDTLAIRCFVAFTWTAGKMIVMCMHYCSTNAEPWGCPGCRCIYSYIFIHRFQMCMPFPLHVTYDNVCQYMCGRKKTNKQKKKHCVSKQLVAFKLEKKKYFCFLFCMYTFSQLGVYLYDIISAWKNN